MDDVIKIINKQMVNLSLQVNRNAGYLARQEIDKILKNIKNSPKRLEHFGFKVYSQNDEDGIIEEIFNRLNIYKGVFCEIGVQNGLECNSLYLIHKGWKGIWIEGDVKHASFIEKKFEPILVSNRLILCNNYAHPKNINDLILNKLHMITPSDSYEIDLLSIDVDGMDIYLLEAISFNPKVICIEYNAKFPSNISKKPIYSESYCWRGSDYMGSSLRSLDEVASLKGYSLVATNITGANAFFVRSDLINDKFEMTGCETLYNPPRYYLCYDHFMKIGHKSDFGPYVDLVIS